ncbi:MAG TPA: SWIM zinc finger family protein, partial [Anaerolineae bacterium]
MSLPKLTESIVRAGASSQSFARGQEYYDSGAIFGASIQGDLLSGECEGTSAPYYQVRVTLDKSGIVSADCTCPYEYGGYCK